ncbi:MAG: hypothetical protein MJA82_02430, partial [Clostridia bacterium]|nr:hypothetical protein [Clostridia bacterium]
ITHLIYVSINVKIVGIFIVSPMKMKFINVQSVTLQMYFVWIKVTFVKDAVKEKGVVFSTKGYNFFVYILKNFLDRVNFIIVIYIEEKLRMLAYFSSHRESFRLML